MTSFSRVRRRLKRDVKYLAKQFHPYFVSEDKILQWIDETLERINSHFSQFKNLVDSNREFSQSLLTDAIYQPTDLNNQWRQLQLKRAKILFPNLTSINEKELLGQYQKHIIKIYTPAQSKTNRLPLKNKTEIDLETEYVKVEQIGREYLETLFANYRKRQRPNLVLVREMIDHGMKQMIKRPKSNQIDEIYKSTNILSKALFIIKSKNAYSMSLKNVSDDFMVNESVYSSFVIEIYLFIFSFYVLVEL